LISYRSPGYLFGRLGANVGKQKIIFDSVVNSIADRSKPMVMKARVSDTKCLLQCTKTVNDTIKFQLVHYFGAFLQQICWHGFCLR